MDTNTSVQQVPPAVDQAAAQRGLGAFVDVRREVSTLAAVIIGWGVAAGSALLLWLVASVGSDQSVFSVGYSILHAIAWVFVFPLLWGIVYGIRGLVVGTRAHFLYAGGIVHRRRTGLRVVAWRDVTLFKTVYSKSKQGEEGKVLGYQVTGSDGARFAIPLALVDGRDAFIDRIVAALREHGVKIA